MSRDVLEQVISGIDDRYIAESIVYADRRKENSTNNIHKILEFNDESRERKRVMNRLNMENSGGGKKDITRSKCIIKYAVRIAACLVLVIVMSFSTLSIAAAGGSITAYDILYSLYPEVAEKLTPVNLSCEDNGIRMNVEAVNVDGATADIYISMQDTTGNRIDETTDLFDSADIHTSSDIMGGCEMVDYDSENKKATFLIQLKHMNGNPVEGKKLTFTVSKFLSGKQNTVTELSGFSLSNIPVAEKVQKAEELQFRGHSGEEGQFHTDYLLPDPAYSYSPVDGVTVNAYGFVNGKLHVQVHYDNIMTYDNHGFIYLKNADGNTIDCSYSDAFWDDEQYGSSEEYVFDVGEDDDLSSCSLWGEFITCNTLTEGDWEVAFPVKVR